MPDTENTPVPMNAGIDWPRWNRIAPREIADATDNYLDGDPWPTFEHHFEEWIDATGLWSGCLTKDHDAPLVLVCRAHMMWILEDRWDELLYEMERDANERHPSLTAAERNR